MTTEFFLTLRDDTTVWCSEHDAPIDKWQTGPAFKDRAEAEKFIADSRSWYESDTGPDHCLFRHPENAASVTGTGEWRSKETGESTIRVDGRRYPASSSGSGCRSR